MKYLFPFILCIITGFLMGIFLYNGYNKEISIPVMKDTNQIYFIKYSEFDTKKQMEKSLTNFKNYIYKQDSTYTVYFTLTTNKENIDKIKGYYKDLGYIVSIEEKNIDLNIYNELIDYDTLLLETNDKEVIQNILYAIVDKYKELYS